jgi:glucokinase
MDDYILLSDISHADYQKLALTRRGERPQETTHYVCRNLEEFKTAIKQFMEASACDHLAGAAISAAGWENHGSISLPNHGFAINRAEMREFLDVRRLNLVNDLVATALAVPRLESFEREQICGGAPAEEQVIGVLGANLGLGQAALAPDGIGGWTALPCEGGHSDLAATNDLEDEVLKLLTRRFGHVSRERVVSVPGLGNVWSALADIERDTGVATPSPEEIVAAASAGESRAVRAVELSLGWFAAMASDVALILGARGGVYLTGELLELLGDLFDSESFVKRYCDKGRLSGYVSDVPLFKVTAHDTEVIGLATLF